MRADTIPGAAVKPSPGIIMLIVHTGVVFSAVLFTGLLALNVPAAGLLRGTSLLFLGVVIWLFYSWKKIKGTLFDPYALFLFAAVIFNGGQVILEVFGLNPEGILDGEFTPETLMRTVLLVMFALLMLHFGALLAASTGGRKEDGPSKAPEQLERRSKEVRVVGWILLILSFPFAAMMLKEAVTIVASSGYLGLYKQDNATGVMATPRILAAFLVPSALFLLAGSRGKPWLTAGSGLLIALYTAVLFFLGTRAAAVMPLVAYFWLLRSRIYKIPMALLVTLACSLMFLVFPVVAAIRELSAEARSSVSLVDIYLRENPVVASLKEMGMSMNTVAYTLDLMPSVRSFDHGAGYWNAMLIMIPNLFWDIHPAIAHGLSADWLVWTVDPGYAASGGGYGYSFIAETYFNFGWAGPVLLAPLGFAFVKFSRWAEAEGGPGQAAMMAVFLSFFLVFARSETASIIRPLLWYSFCPYLMLYGVRYLRKHLKE